MSSFIKFPRDRIRIVAALFGFVSIVVTTLLSFAISERVWTHWLWLLPVVAFGSHVLAGGYRATLVYRGVVQVLSAALVSSALAAIPIYILLGGSDTSRILFLGTVWIPLTCVGLLLSYLAQRQLLSFTRTVPYHLVGVLPEMRERLREALASRREVQVESINDISVEDFPDGDPSGHRALCVFEPGDVVVFGDDAVRSSIVAKRLLALKVAGADVYRDYTLYTELTGRLPITSRAETGFVGIALEQTKTGIHTRIVDGVRSVANLLGGVFLLITLAIPMAIIAVTIRLGDSGPVLFRQERLGKNKKPFWLYKFRTMYVGADKDGPQWTAVEDSRVTPLGRVMRELHLDEMPQVFNLCRRDINFVGPRPMGKVMADLLGAEIPDLDVRFLVKPGLTGWAQTLGPYGHNMAERVEKTEYDLFYVTNRHRLSDLMIIGMTVSTFVHSVVQVSIGTLRRPRERKS